MSEILQEPSGRTSSTRVLMLATGATVLAMMVAAQFAGKPLPELPMEYVALLAGVMGLKVLQKEKEQPKQ